MLYETVFIFSGQLTPKSAEQKFNDCVEKITKKGGKILKQESWGLRSLSYKIKKNSKGYYYLINSDSDSEVLNSFNMNVKQDEEFLRLLNIKIQEVDKNQSFLDENRSEEKNEK
jgi:small subunit ribosomal protein S6|tara:strand:- start:378 stop:719 length:342 start_codon:yes stop_codon:yes gene_type:complete